MAIDFIPFEELFAHDYQLTYISVYGDIVVGPYTYNVFREYTTTERQKIYQDCAKWLNWPISEVQEEWELCMYVYQWVIKNPPPFPYLEYTLNEEITMALTLKEETVLKLLVADLIAQAKLNVTNTAMRIEIQAVDADLRAQFKVQDAAIRETYRATYEAQEEAVKAAKEALEAECE